ncbi:hypothetical protein CGMCC3_g14422 [Colletotrichum fructicola]|nr:uncharacterized protein CGMCC3_g14422 [Colletotrichum fructicola]KAE9569588.1 hypothetical protein CGMCC3_g14422 [Colletotrichum fructicola]
MEPDGKVSVLWGRLAWDLAGDARSSADIAPQIV